MTGIDRRSLMTAAGAGLLLSSYDLRAQPAVISPQTTGYCDHYGMLATAERPYFQNEEANFEFKPKYICVLYVRFEENRTLKVRTAHVDLEIGSPTEDQIKLIVKPVLDMMRRGRHASIAARRKEESFERFNFSSPHILVMFVDNNPEDVGFDNRHGKNYIIRFTQFSGSDPRKPNINMNNAFCNLKPLIFANPSPLRTNLAYYLEYWNTDAAGDQITGRVPSEPLTHYLFSMNIHLKMAVRTTAGETSWVPLILDPDTGNGGYDP